MGRVRTKTVKKSSRQVIEKYYSRMTLDFHTNKKILEEVAIIPSKRLRNKIAGFSTHLMKRIQKGPVRGISLKLQEEERERRMDFVPDESAIKTDEIKVDKETLEMLASLGMSDVPGVSVVEPQAVAPAFGRPPRSVCEIEGSSGVLTETFAPDWSSHNHHRSSYLDQVFDVDPEEDVDE
ncbi:hypothetical protein HID58_044880 [Brassica napus]|uniref:40S ribosomal protein S17 n=1 Tax=Brassica napus TaxID=3708 RepID=A0ABQ8ASS4_BRANA|nr:hypothetical protein HID58_044880 [Brassica napus]